MNQLSLFTDVATIPSPWCIYSGQCARKGRAVVGPPVDHGTCVNRVIRCLSCPAYGEESRRK